MKRKRTIYDIIADILEFVVAGGEARISYISRYANLPIDRANSLVEEMVRAGLLKLAEYENHRIYKPSKNSYKYLAHYRELKKLLATIIK